MSFEWLPKCSRVCSRTGRVLEVGETCYSALLEDRDGRIFFFYFSPEAWPPSSENHVLGWWRFVIPEGTENRMRLAPNDILLELFDKWVLDPSRAEELYILSLLLLRRRVFRYENSAGHREGKDLLLVYSPRRETTYSIPVVSLTDGRISEIQQELAELLYSGDSSEKSEDLTENAESRESIE